MKPIIFSTTNENLTIEGLSPRLLPLRYRIRASQFIITEMYDWRLKGKFACDLLTTLNYSCTKGTFISVRFYLRDIKSALSSISDLFQNVCILYLTKWRWISYQLLIFNKNKFKYWAINFQSRARDSTPRYVRTSVGRLVGPWHLLFLSILFL